MRCLSIHPFDPANLPRHNTFAGDDGIFNPIAYGIGALPRRRGAPGEEAVVFEARLAVSERGAVETEDKAAGGFEHRLAGGGVPFHRRAEARVEISFAR